MSQEEHVVRQEVKVPNVEGMHARPIMKFVDRASTFSSRIWVTNRSRGNERIDGKSPMQMMLLEATQGSILLIEASGDDAQEAVYNLSELVESGFNHQSTKELETK